MQIDKNCKLEKAVSKDDMRPIMKHINYEKNRLIATNGHIMAIIPASPDSDDTDGLISVDAYKHAGKTRSGILFANGSLKNPDTGVSFDRPKGEYPDYLGVIPTDEAEYSICINPKLLMDLAEAIGSKEGVILEFTGKKRAIRVKGEGGFGLLMPKFEEKQAFNGRFIQAIYRDACPISPKVLKEIQALNQIAENQRKIRLYNELKAKEANNAL